MPRRLAVARQHGGFDALGWTLVGFLLGASLAVFALLHADFGAITRPLAGASAPPPVPVIRYTPPAPPAGPPLAGASQALPVSLTPTQAAPAAAPARSGVSALASAGAASAHAASSDSPPAAPKPAASRSVAASAPATDAEVADDAAAAGMTSRAGAAPAPASALY